jgi:hypothetical protein
MPGPLVGTSENGWAVWGGTNNGTGTVGTAGNGVGAYGDSRYGNGVVGKCIQGNNNGVRGEGWNGNGVSGSSRFGTGVDGYGDSEPPGVRGYSRLGRGVVGQGHLAGLWGRATGSGALGVRGESEHGHGVHGIGLTGVYGYSPTSHYAGWFLGNVHVAGTLTKVGGGFSIDHPLDATNKYLKHSFVESSERKNFYDGIVTLEENGEAWVDLPEWFEALNGDNGDFCYQLTAVGGAAPNLHVGEEIYENRRFKIAGGEEGMKVCWQVTGSRKDPWAAANPFEVEQEKPEEERGRYMQPHLYGAPEDQMINPPELAPDNGEVSSELPQIPETPPGTPPGFGAPGFGHLGAENTEELRGQIEELRRQIEELKRRQ